jgi:hypothetical protein
MVNAPLLVPPVVGSKNTATLQLEPGATVLMQLLNTPKSAAVEPTAVIASVAFPAFDTMTVFGRPLVPTY